MRRVPTRSASVSSSFSSTSTYDSKLSDADAQHYSDVNELRKRLQECLTERDVIKRELTAKKEEILGLRDKIMQMKRELSEVTTTKGALNEACVSGMMDAFALNSKIAELEDEKEALARQNVQLKHDAADYDRERRGLLDLLDDGKHRLKECEKMLEMEVARSKEMEGGRSAAAERLGMELKWVRRELAEKTLRIKKLARTNTKLACKLLALEEEGAEANNLAKMLQSQNMQLEGDNQELASFVLQLESQIDQLANKRTGAVCDMRTQQATRLEEERAMVLNDILAIEEAIDKTKKELADGQKQDSDLQALLEGKVALQSRVSILTRDIEALKVEDQMQEEAEMRMREDYVQRLETELHAAKARIDELSKMLKGARVSETESMSSQVKASGEISKLESEKSMLREELLDLQEKLKRTQHEMQNQAENIRQERESEIQDLQDDRVKLEKRLASMEKQLAEYHRVKQETDNIVRKLRQDIREHDQQKETLAYQVNVLEWQLVGLYSDKEDAIRSLADRDMEVMRLQQELDDKEDDLERIKQDISDENEAQIEACELRYEKEQLEDALEEKQHYILALEYELEQVKKDKSIVDEHVKESKMKKQRPWFTFKIKF